VTRGDPAQAHALQEHTSTSLIACCVLLARPTLILRFLANHPVTASAMRVTPVQMGGRVLSVQRPPTRAQVEANPATLAQQMPPLLKLVPNQPTACATKASRGALEYHVWPVCMERLSHQQGLQTVPHAHLDPHLVLEVS